MPPKELTRDQRAEVLRALSEIMAQRFYDPAMRGVDWPAAVANHHEAIVNAPTEEKFEIEVTELLRELKSSHVGFYRERPKRASARMAICACYTSIPFVGRDHWVFQDVHAGGPGGNAGIRPGDILLSVDGREYRPPEHPIFPLGSSLKVEVLTSNSDVATRQLNIPAPVQKKFQLPHVEPALVVHRRLRDDIGYIRISMFPGIVGLEVANEISTAVDQLNPVERLIIDLRGNSGGGAAVVRVMSLLTSKRLPIGYSLHRCQLGISANQDHFPVYDKIPSQQLALKMLLLKFGWRLVALHYRLPVKPVLLRTERPKAEPFHGRVALLVDRHTASASEMIVAFARENQLAVLVGEATSGRLLDGDDFKLPGGYKVAIPVGAYRTARGWILEGSPIMPDVEVPFDPELAREGKDPQMERAIEVVSSL